jgi:arsenate reductase
MLFLEYPKCSTCKKAKAFLTENNIKFEDRHIVENNPTATELKVYLSKSGVPLKRPLLIGDDFVLIGFKETEWTEKLIEKIIE